MGKFNKATASVVGGAVTTVIGSLFPDLGADVIGAIGTLITSALVFLAPANKTA